MNTNLALIKAKFMIIFSLVVLVSFFLASSCTKHNKGTLNNVKLEEVESLCKENGGISRVFLNVDSYKVYCVNGAYSSKNTLDKDKDEVVASDQDPSVTAQEIVECKKLCDKNGGVKEINTEQDCTKWVPSGRTSTCEERADLVTCTCQNTIKTNSKRVIWLR